MVDLLQVWRKMETVYIWSIPEQNLEVGLYPREVMPITVTERHTPSAWAWHGL